MKKISFVLLSFIVSSILILTNCSSGSSSKDNNGTSEKEEIKIVEESEIIATDEFLKFCDEFYKISTQDYYVNFEKYNPAKFKVKQEEFKDKWIVLSGKISDIEEDGDITIYIKDYDEKDVKIEAGFDFGSPERVMNFEIGQEIKIKAKYDHVIKYKQYCCFYFENPQVIE